MVKVTRARRFYPATPSVRNMAQFRCNCSDGKSPLDLRMTLHLLAAAAGCAGQIQIADPQPVGLPRVYGLKFPIHRQVV